MQHLKFLTNSPLYLLTVKKVRIPLEDSAILGFVVEVGTCLLGVVSILLVILLSSVDVSSTVVMEG